MFNEALPAFMLSLSFWLSGSQTFLVPSNCKRSAQKQLLETHQQLINVSQHRWERPTSQKSDISIT